MMYRKPFPAISADPVWWMLLSSLFLIPFSMAACSILFSLLLALFILSLIRGESLPPPPPFVIWLVVYAGLTLVSTLFSTDPMTSLADNRELLVFLLIPIFQQIIDSPRRLDITLKVVLASAVGSALIGLAGALRNGVSLSHRLRGLTSHWMTWSGLLMLAFVFFTVWATTGRTPSIRRRWLYAPPLLLILTAIVLSLTRSAWVGLAAALGLYILTRRPRILFYLLPLMAAAWMVLPQSVTHRFRSIVDPADPTNLDRIHMFYTGWHIFLDHPLTGSGPNTIEAQYPRYRHPQATQNNPHLHNNFLQILAERGLPAALALLGFFISLLVSLIQRWRWGNGPPRRLAAAALFATVAFLTAGMFEYNLGDTEIQFFFLFLITLPFLTAMPPRDESEAT